MKVQSDVMLETMSSQKHGWGQGVQEKRGCVRRREGAGRVDVSSPVREFTTPDGKVFHGGEAGAS